MADENQAAENFDNMETTPTSPFDNPYAVPKDSLQHRAGAQESAPQNYDQPIYQQPTTPMPSPYDGVQGGIQPPMQPFDATQAAAQDAEQPFSSAQPTTEQPFSTEPQYGTQPGVAPASYSNNGSDLGTTPMILGILSIVFAFLFALVGLILSIIGITKSGKVLASNPNNSRAKTGKVTSIIGLIGSILSMVIGIIMAVMIVMSAATVAEDPDAFIGALEEVAAQDETGELQKEVDQLKEDIDSATSAGVGTSSSQETSEHASSSAPSTELSKENALKEAKSYLEFTPMSYDGLVQQLEFEKYSHEDAVYAADNCGADWREQAQKAAKSYLGSLSFSKSGLESQLEYEGFSHEDSAYAVENCGADWKEQAAKSAASYQEFSPMSRDELIDQLVYEGYTQEEATYGVDKIGL